MTNKITSGGSISRSTSAFTSSPAVYPFRNYIYEEKLTERQEDIKNNTYKDLGLLRIPLYILIDCLFVLLIYSIISFIMFDILTSGIFYVIRITALISIVIAILDYIREKQDIEYVAKLTLEKV